MNNPIALGIMAFVAATLARIISQLLGGGNLNLIPAIAGAAVFAVIFAAIIHWQNNRRSLPSSDNVSPN